MPSRVGVEWEQKGVAAVDATRYLSSGSATVSATKREKAEVEGSKRDHGGFGDVTADDGRRRGVSGRRGEELD